MSEGFADFPQGQKPIEAFATFKSSQPSTLNSSTSPQNPSQQASPPRAPKSFKFDPAILQKYQPEDQDVVLFNWLSNFKQDLEHVDKATLKPFQQDIEKIFIGLIGQQKPKTLGGIRQLIGHCLCLMYSKGETRTLFDTITNLQNTITNTKEPLTKRTAIYCLGRLSQEHGNSVLSLFAGTVGIFQKLLKSSSESTILRVETLNALAASYRGSGRGANDQLNKEVVKVVKPLLTDRILDLRIAAIKTIHALVASSNFYESLDQAEFEQWIPALAKALDQANFATRREVASVISTFLICAYTVPLKQQVKKKKKKAAAPASSPTDPGTTDTEEVPQTLSLPDLLGYLLAVYGKSQNRETRIGIMECYAEFISRLGPSCVETNYILIVEQITKITDPKFNPSRNDIVRSRKICVFILHEIIGRQMLTEAVKTIALQELVEHFLSKKENEQDTPLIDKSILVCVLYTMSHLLMDLGSAASGLETPLFEPLCEVLTYPSNSVQVAGAWCIRCLCLALPSCLPKFLSTTFSFLKKELPSPTHQVPTLVKCLSYSMALCSLISIIPLRALYGSYDTPERAFTLSIQMLKSGSSTSGKDTRVKSIKTKIAWNIISALMTLGSKFVKIHLSQLILLWNNALPKPTNVKDANASKGKSESEWLCLLESREAALGALCNFLQYNMESLQSPDIGKRIVVLLNNSLAFISSVPTSWTPSPSTPSQVSSKLLLPMSDLDRLLRHRLFDCYALLNTVKTYETSWGQILKACVDIFYIGDQLGTSSSSGGATLWGTTDPNGLYTTSLVDGMDVCVEYESEVSQSESEDDGMGRNMLWKSLEDMLQQPVCGSLEYDPLYLCDPNESSEDIPSPMPSFTALTNTAIILFTKLFPYQNMDIQTVILEQLLKPIRATKPTEKLPLKKMAYQLNVVVTFYQILRLISESKKWKEGSLNLGGNVAIEFQSLLQSALVQPDPCLRSIASQAIGYLTTVVSPAYTATLVQGLVDQVVANVDPDARSGYCLSVAQVFKHSGGIGSTSFLKSAHRIITALSQDPHPTVHLWALRSLWIIVDTSGLDFSSFVASTMKVVSKLLMADLDRVTFPVSAEGSGAVMGSHTGLAETKIFLAKIIYSITGTIGPELRTSDAQREMFLYLIDYLKLDEDPYVSAEAIRCIRALIMFAPGCVGIETLVPYLQQLLFTRDIPTRKNTLSCLYQLIQRDAPSVLNRAVGELEQQLFGLLDSETNEAIRKTVKNAIVNILEQTGTLYPSKWINLFKSIISKTVNKGNEKGGTNVAGDIAPGEDPEEAGLGQGIQGGASQQEQGVGPALLQPNWKTQMFALSCFRKLLEMFSPDKKEHFDLKLAREYRKKDRNADLLVLKMGDFIKMSFTAATATMIGLRLEGLNAIKEIIERFGSTEDPDYEGHALMEQYHAQLCAALTPSFSWDSPPEVLATACRICAIYVGSGINREVSALGRVLKLLTSALDRCKDESTFNNLGESSELSPHAAVVVKLSVLTAWAELYLASSSQKYLVEVVEPNLNFLPKMWLDELRDFAKVNLDPDLLGVGPNMMLGNPAASFDPVDMAPAKFVLLPFYNKSWIVLLQAVSKLCEEKEDIILRYAAEKEEANPDLGSGKVFYILFGLCIEHMSTSTGNDTEDSLTYPLLCTHVLQRLLRPSLTGAQFLSREMFLEMLQVMNRLMLTGTMPLQLAIVDTLSQFINNYGSSFFFSEEESTLTLEEHESPVSQVSDSGPPVSKLYAMLQFLFTLFTYYVPHLAETLEASVASAKILTEHGEEIVVKSAECLIKLATISNPERLCDISGVILYIFSIIFESERFAENVTPRILPLLKELFIKMSSEPSTLEAARKLSLGLLSNLMQFLDAFTDSAPTITLSIETMMKNIALAAVVIITTAPSLVENEYITSKFSTILANLLDPESPQQLHNASFQSIKAFIALKLRGSTESKHLAEEYLTYLIPHLFQRWYHGGEKGKTQFRSAGEEQAYMKEVLSILVSYFWTITEVDKKMDYLTFLTSTILVTTTSDSPTEAMAFQQLLQVAGKDPSTFKEVLGGLPQGMKQTLQGVFMKMSQVASSSSTMASTRVANVSEKAGVPGIQLKATFGNF